MMDEMSEWLGGTDSILLFGVWIQPGKEFYDAPTTIRELGQYFDDQGLEW